MNTIAHPDARELQKFFTRFEHLTGFDPLSLDARRACRDLLAGKVIVIKYAGPMVMVKAIGGANGH